MWFYGAYKGIAAKQHESSIILHITNHFYLKVIVDLFLGPILIQCIKEWFKKSGPSELEKSSDRTVGFKKASKNHKTEENGIPSFISLHPVMKAFYSVQKIHIIIIQ